jgi:hypothetical protein
MKTDISTHIISSSALLSIINVEKNNSGANFTIKSKKTGKDYTYKISRNFYKNNWYTHIYVETDYLNFVRLGSYFKGFLYNKGQKVDSPSANAIAWVLRTIESDKVSVVDENVDVMHTGHCLRCGRELTDAVSIQFGLGAVCRSGK